MASIYRRQRSSIWIQLIICFPFPSMPAIPNLTGLLNSGKAPPSLLNTIPVRRMTSLLPSSVNQVVWIFPRPGRSHQEIRNPADLFPQTGNLTLLIPADGRCTHHRYYFVGNTAQGFYQQFTASCAALYYFLFPFLCPGFICYACSGQMNDIFCFSELHSSLTDCSSIFQAA